MAAAQKVVLNNLENKNESMSGVNINEEMSDVIKFQQGFRANNRVLSVIAEMLDSDLQQEIGTVVDEMNTNYDGRYIFGGSKTAK